MKKFKLLALLLTCGAFWGTNCCAKSAAAKERYNAARAMLTVVESDGIADGFTSYKFKDRTDKYNLTGHCYVRWFAPGAGVVLVKYVQNDKGQERISEACAGIILPGGTDSKSQYVVYVNKDFWLGYDKHKSHMIGAIRKVFREKILTKINPNNGNSAKSTTDKQEEDLIDLSAL